MEGKRWMEHIYPPPPALRHLYEQIIQGDLLVHVFGVLIGRKTSTKQGKISRFQDFF